MSLPIATIKTAVSDACGVSVAEMESERRQLPVVRARMIAMTLARRLTPRSFPVIARQFGGRDHRTVMHAVQRIAELEARDPETASRIAAIEAQLKQRQETIMETRPGEIAGVDPIGVALRCVESRRGAIGVTVNEAIAMATALIDMQRRLNAIEWALAGGTPPEATGNAAAEPPAANGKETGDAQG